MKRHGPALAVLAAGAALRTVVVVAYDPLFWFTDTGRYLRYAALGRPDTQRPWGYSGFLRLTLHPLTERGVVVLQHALVLACAAALYAFLVRRGVRPGAGAAAIAPLCLSPLVVNVEHHLLSDWQFLVLVAVALVLVGWRDDRPAAWSCLLAGLALGAAVDTRQIGLPLLAVVAGYLLVRRAGAVRVGALAAGAAAPVAAYLLWMHATYGVYDFTTWSGKMLYARVAPIARCDRLGALTARQRELCDPRPPARRPGQSEYLWTGGTGPQRHLPDPVVLAFARKVVVHQPLAYARTVAVETGEAFLPGRTQHRGAACVAYWDYPDPWPGGCRTDAVGTRLWREHPFRPDRALAAGLSAYQRVDAAAGPLLAACLLLVAVRLSRLDRRRRQDALLFALAGLALLLATFATADFTYRYTLPLYATLPVAAGLALGRPR